MAEMAEAEQYWGQVKSFNEMKGWGFIECAETHAFYGKDMFFAKRAVIEGSSVRPGDQVSFFVETDANSQPSAVQVQVHSAAPGQLSQAATETFSGTVKSYNDGKGWGFIECETTHKKYGRDVFLPKRQIPGGFVSPGTKVRFSVQEEAAGPCAANVQLLQNGAKRTTIPAAYAGAVAAAYAGAVAASHAGAGDHVGTVKSYNEAKGYGFIECAETQAIYGKDIFLPKRELPSGPANVGDTVSFSVQVEATGAVAKNVRTLYTGGKVGQNGHAFQQTFQQAFPQTVGTPSFPFWFEGTIKSFNEAKGYGMIKCDQTEQTYGKDVFFPREVFPAGLSAGAPVSFQIKVEQKGPIAVSISPIAGMKSRGVVKNAPMMSPIAYFQQGAAANPAKSFCGTVKSWDDVKGYGHISCEATQALYGKDVFLLRGKLGDSTVQAGSLVTFKCVMSAKGPQADQVTVIAPVLVGSNGAPSDVFHQGSVKSFNQEKGWGFIEGDGVQQTFGADIFMHKNELGLETPSVGDTVIFNVELDKGRLVAKNVSLASGMPHKAPIAGRKVARAAPY